MNGGRTDDKLTDERMRRIVAEDLAECVRKASLVRSEDEGSSVRIPANEFRELGSREEVVKLRQAVSVPRQRGLESRPDVP
jgi:hypothetical protein